MVSAVVDVAGMTKVLGLMITWEVIEHKLEIFRQKKKKGRVFPMGEATALAEKPGRTLLLLR